MARNTKGDGSITQIKDKNGKPIPNRWRVCVSLGTDLSGNRIKVQRNVNGTKAQARKVRAAISNTFGFGGHNACVVFKKYID